RAGGGGAVAGGGGAGGRGRAGFAGGPGRCPGPASTIVVLAALDGSVSRAGGVLRVVRTSTAVVVGRAGPSHERRLGRVARGAHGPHRLLTAALRSVFAVHRASPSLSG